MPPLAARVADMCLQKVLGTIALSPIEEPDKFISQASAYHNLTLVKAATTPAELEQAAAVVESHFILVEQLSMGLSVGAKSLKRVLILVRQSLIL